MAWPPGPGSRPTEIESSAVRRVSLPQLQHNMWVTHLRTLVLSIITGGGKCWRSRFPWTHFISASSCRRKRNTESQGAQS